MVTCLYNTYQWLFACIFCHFFNSCRRMKSNELIVFRQVPGDLEVNLGSKGLTYSLHYLSSQQALLQVYWGPLHEAGRNVTFWRNAFQMPLLLWPLSCHEMCRWTILLSWDVICWAVCIQLSEKGLCSVQRLTWIFYSFDYGNLSSVSCLLCLCSNRNMVYSLVCFGHIILNFTYKWLLSIEFAVKSHGVVCVKFWPQVCGLLWNTALKRKEPSNSKSLLLTS